MAVLHADQPGMHATLTVLSTSLKHKESSDGALSHKHTQNASKRSHLVRLNEVLKSDEQFGDQRSH